MSLSFSLSLSLSLYFLFIEEPVFPHVILMCRLWLNDKQGRKKSIETISSFYSLITAVLRPRLLILFDRHVQRIYIYIYKHQCTITNL